jgi:hypothetical protein
MQLGHYDLVDVGAGDGTFLDVAKPLVRNISALEMSENAKKILSQKGYLLTQPLECITPKIVTAFQVIEHLKEPRTFIKDLHISDKDWFVFTSPSPESPTALRLHSTGRWQSLSPSHHLCLYSKRGLERIAYDCGLELVHFDYVFSGCHGAIDNFFKNIKKFAKWPIKKMAGRRDPLPNYFGKNSFIAVVRCLKR